MFKQWQPICSVVLICTYPLTLLCSEDLKKVTSSWLAISSLRLRIVWSRFVFSCSTFWMAEGKQKIKYLYESASYHFSQAKGISPMSTSSMSFLTAWHSCSSSFLSLRASCASGDEKTGNCCPYCHPWIEISGGR